MAAVLLVEPHADTRELYVEFLALSGYTVEVADSTEAARVLARECDVVVTEIAVPGPTDGIGLIRTLHDDAATATVPVIVVSARSYATDIASATAAGCVLFLPKPCLPVTLQAAVRRVLADARRRRTLKMSPDSQRTRQRQRNPKR
jgi:CheY-like chemotaxis protein